tara:strand:- start:41529 stop:41630 length:102 start_codon:yes stop_codon:yes gene_type:complete
MGKKIEKVKPESAKNPKKLNLGQQTIINLKTVY